MRAQSHDIDLPSNNSKPGAGAISRVADPKNVRAGPVCLVHVLMTAEERRGDLVGSRWCVRRPVSLLRSC